MGASATIGLSAGGVSFDGLVPFAFNILMVPSLSLGVVVELFDFAACFELPPMRLRRMFHLPLPTSSSGKSRESTDIDEVGRTSGSGGVMLVGVGFRW